MQHLQKVQPDVLIAEAGTLGLQPALSGCEALSCVIWVTKAGNEHMNFAETPGEVEGKVDISTWHDLIEENKSPASMELPSIDRGNPSPSLSIVESSSNSTSVVEYTSEVSNQLWALLPIPAQLHHPSLTLS
jgi:hypothetical protein